MFIIVLIFVVAFRINIMVILIVVVIVCSCSHCPDIVTPGSFTSVVSTATTFTSLRIVVVIIISIIVSVIFPLVVVIEYVVVVAMRCSGSSFILFLLSTKECSAGHLEGAIEPW